MEWPGIVDAQCTIGSVFASAYAWLILTHQQAWPQMSCMSIARYTLYRMRYDDTIHQFTHRNVLSASMGII